MSGWWKPIEVGVCIETPGDKIDQGAWRYQTVTIPANTPLEKISDVALERVLDALDEVHIHHHWIQRVGKPVRLEDEDIPMSESEQE